MHRWTKALMAAVLGVAVVPAVARDAAAASTPDQEYERAWGLVIAHPDRYAGVDIRGSAVTLVTTRDEGRAQAAALGVPTRSGPRSYEQLETLERDALQLALKVGGTVAVASASEPVTGTVTVTLSRDSQPVRRALAASFGATVGVVVDPSRAIGRLTTRMLDAPAHYGGAAVAMRDAAGRNTSGWCSTAFAVVINGTAGMMTAGHCLPTTNAGRPFLWAENSAEGLPQSSPYYIGRRLTTTWIGTQDRLGDWAPVTGGTGGYAGRIYSTGPLDTTSNAALAVKAVSWGSVPVGRTLCFSGRTSGQVCRLHIIRNDVTIAFCIDEACQATLLVAHQIETRSDQNNDGTFDCTTSQHGDSGGAAYFGVTGGVQVAGIVSGFGSCFSYFTNLIGLRSFYGTGISVRTA